MALYGVFSAIKQNNVYWYSYFVVGVFFICDYIDYLVRKKSILSLVFDKKASKFILIYSLFVLFTIFCEIYGRIIGNMWYYPNFGSIDLIIHVFLIGYPFGAFSVVALYNVFIDFSRRIFKHKTNYNFAEKLMNKLSPFFLSLSVLVFVILVIYYIYSGSLNSKIMFLAILWLLGIEAIRFKIKRQSILYEIFAGNYSVLFSIIITVVISGFIHEVPNTFSYEWVYQNTPFINYEIWDVNLLVLTAGWLYLTVASIDLYKFVHEDKETLVDKFREKISEI